MSATSSRKTAGGRRRGRAQSRDAAPQAEGRGTDGGSSPDPSNDLKELPLAEVEKRLDTSPDGLTAAEAKKRLAKYGPNEIEEESTSWLRALLAYFWGPIPWMIEIAVVLSAALGHWADFFIILVLLVANAASGSPRSIRRARRSPRSRRSWRSRRGSCATESGSPRRRVSWCRVT
jgi:magnesium-transporting ATPase (P-type)